MEDKNIFDKYVRSELLTSNQFSIEEVNDLSEIDSLPFSLAEYPKILALIKEHRFDEIQKMSRLYKAHDREYLIIMKFNDQQESHYIITVYDSDELWQNPRVMDILKV